MKELQRGFDLLPVTYTLMATSDLTPHFFLLGTPSPIVLKRLKATSPWDNELISGPL
jgi:hypothetical protein